MVFVPYSWISNQGPCLYMILLLQVIHLWLVSQLAVSIPSRPIRPRLHFGYRCVLGSTFGHHAVLPLLAFVYRWKNELLLNLSGRSLWTEPVHM